MGAEVLEPARTVEQSTLLDLRQSAFGSIMESLPQVDAKFAPVGGLAKILSRAGNLNQKR